MSDLTTTQNGNPIVWEGHLCEGAQMRPSNSDTFILWTRCGKHDVPPNKGREGEHEDVTCSDCKVFIQ